MPQEEDSEDKEEEDTEGERRDGEDGGEAAAEENEGRGTNSGARALSLLKEADL